jgi:hypothetical protein
MTKNPHDPPVYGIRWPDDHEPFATEWFDAAYPDRSAVTVYAGVNGGDPCIGIRAPGGTWRRTAVPQGSTRGDVRRFMTWQRFQESPRKEGSDDSQDS